MGWNWLFAVLLLLPAQEYQLDTLTIEHQGEVVAHLTDKEYIYPLPSIPLVNDEKLAKLMDDIEKKIERKPVNASLNGAGQIVPEKPGVRLNREAFKEDFYRYIYEHHTPALEVPLVQVYPRVDSEMLSSIKSKLIGAYVTYYNSRNKNRSENIALAAKTINNVVVFPGERFSFNQIVGKRTKDKGYKRAPVIVRGEMFEDVGGGICQVSSTLFNAADRAGLKIVERYTHSRRVPYVPSGRDATVSWYGPDFVFQNSYHEPVLIRAFAQAGQMSVSIYSSELIDHKKREVPSASKKLPEEVRVEDINVNGR
ncbi:VanW family protein [Paenibacillus sp. 1001270B_150601_E10]|uniref:VanW family protein n=1 Tax=Paenibacillus sp. 1001270B_150601_E10 TaxID=2787079 RepID=UPI0018A01E2D|nr:VanW family protein [Paenibacillus sp. 1001270B_150601_E10]